MIKTLLLIKKKINIKSSYLSAAAAFRPFSSFGNFLMTRRFSGFVPAAILLGLRSANRPLRWLGFVSVVDDDPGYNVVTVWAE